MVKFVQNSKRYYWKRETTYDVIPWSRPNLSADGTVGGSSFACVAINAYSGAEAYKAFDSSTTTNWEVINNTAFPHWIEWYNPNALKTTQIEITHGAVLSDIRRFFINEWKLQASEDGNTWIDIASGTAPSTDIQLHRALTISISNTNFYKYWKFFVLSAKGSSTFYSKYAQIYDIAITATQKAPRTFVVPGTEDDYDYYTDGFECKAIKEGDTYKGVNL